MSGANPETARHTETDLRQLMERGTLAGLDPEHALRLLGNLIDSSTELGKLDGLEKAFRLAATISPDQVNAQQAFSLDYFVANAWSALGTLKRQETGQLLRWQNPEAEKEIFHLRRALSHDSVTDKAILCPTLTNLGNALSHVGRHVEAIEYWDKALDLAPTFPMARGNRGIGLFRCAMHVESERDRHALLRQAWLDLEAARGGAERHARPFFGDVLARIGKMASPPCLNGAFDPGSFPADCSEAERQYRTWCLERRLFLNPLNELGTHPVAASDTLHVPTMVVPLDADMRHLGLMNQLKQEYASARFFLYDGINGKGPHFSDKGVRLVNTLDYPSYSLAVEKAKAAFRMAYSILDKIGFFLNDYLGMKIARHEVSFRSIWFRNPKVPENGLRDDMTQHPNAALLALFWLGKDLYENQRGFRDVMQPDAKELAGIRNHLEHKYLKLHEAEWIGLDKKEALHPWDVDALAHSVYRRDFEARALRLLKMVRAALIYLCAAVGVEERRRRQNRKTKEPVLPMPIDYWEDDWKM